MNEIITITKNGFTLNHSWYIDDFGFKRNSFDLFDEKTRTHYPFFGKIRINNFTRSTSLGGDDTSSYTDEEYLEMMEEQLEKLTPHKEL